MMHDDITQAAAILRQYAGELYQGHTIGGEWDGEHIKAEHDWLIALADRLALAQSGEAVANENCLLPCPFCGDDGCSVAVMREGVMSGDDYAFTAEAQCLCGATGPEAYGVCESDASLGAINAWNRHAHPAPSTDRVAELEAQLAESRERVARAYGLLWHVNAGIDAPRGTPSLTPERAAMESRKVLRDMLTNEQRGDGINAARDIMKALAVKQEKNDE